MNDFYSDVHARKVLTYGSRHKKNGSKSKKCSLPSDGMTKKQWKERCGKVVSFSFNKPIAWSDFKELPKATQSEYINNLMSEYGVYGADIADMMGICAGTIRRHVKENDLDVKFQKGGRVSQTNKKRWEIFVNGGVAPVVDETTEMEEPEEIVCEPYVETRDMPSPNTEYVPPFVAQSEPKWRPSGTTVSKFSVDFEGELRAMEIINSILSILGDKTSGKMHIEYELGINSCEFI